MLVPFRGKFRWHMFKKNKPAKYGPNIPILVDGQTNHFISGFLYCGPLHIPNPSKLQVTILTCLSLN